MATRHVLLQSISCEMFRTHTGVRKSVSENLQNASGEHRDDSSLFAGAHFFKTIQQSAMDPGQQQIY